MDLTELVQTLASILPPKAQAVILSLIPAWVAFSLLIDKLNAKARKAAEDNTPWPRTWLTVLGWFNYPALNPGKAAQLRAGYRGPSLNPVPKQ